MTDWLTAIGTLALAVLTGFYVVFTHRLAAQAKEGSEAAERSALSSETAALAASESAAALERAATAQAHAAGVAEAGLNVEFEVTRVVRAAQSRIVIYILSKSASVYFGPTEVRMLVFPPDGLPDGEAFSLREIEATTSVDSDDGAALYAHQGQEFFAVVGEDLPVGTTVVGWVTVHYGFTADNVTRERGFNLGSHQIEAN